MFRPRKADKRSAFEKWWFKMANRPLFAIAGRILRALENTTG